MHRGCAVDVRERWQALQQHLHEARAALEVGDRPRARAHVEQALAIDPQFLAALALREKLTQPAADVAIAVPVPADSAVAPPPEAAEPAVSTEGWAQFEERARRRRVDRRLDAARAALARGRLREAAAAIEEIRELDPNLPDLAAMRAALDGLRLRRAAPVWRRRLPAAAAFAAIVLGATIAERSRELVAYPIPVSTDVATPTTLEPPVLDDADQVSSAVEEVTRTIEPPLSQPADSLAAPAPRPLATSGDDAPRTAEREPAPDVPAAPLTALADRAIPAQAPPRPRAVAPAAAEVVLPPSRPAPPPVENDEALIRNALQLYRSAYDGLDAGSARVVWPAVDEEALARAFDGLESQTITFDRCDVNLAGDAATAVCRGTASYVAKFGSRDLRTEPRVWNFSLRKLGPDWKIEAARAAR